MQVKELFSLEGRVAIVTGGSRGLGRMMAEGLAEAGAIVVLCARDLEACEASAEALRSSGARCMALRCDVTEPAEVEALAERTVEEFGRVDVLVNNAGYTWETRLEDVSLELWERTFAVNTKGTFLCCQHAGRKMIDQKSGKIINIVSVAGMASVDPKIADCVPYGASKGAVAALTRDLARKWSCHNINVNAIAPGYFATKMSRSLLEHRGDAVMNSIPMRRLGKPDEIKGVAVFLASAAADYITGHILAVDGGVLA
jgi:gluconate 5-dehydrogenase